MCGNPTLTGSTDQMIDQVQVKTPHRATGHRSPAGVVDGAEHLAFRNADSDWQVWVETGAMPISR